MATATSVSTSLNRRNLLFGDEGGHHCLKAVQSAYIGIGAVVLAATELFFLGLYFLYKCWRKRELENMAKGVEISKAGKGRR